MKLIRLINTYLIDYNFFIAFCSVSFVAYFSLLMQFGFPYEIYVFTFCATMSTYNLFRGYGTFRDFLDDRKTMRFYLVVTGFAVSSYCYLFLPIEMKLFYFAVGFMTMLYKFNVFGISNLRSIPYLKLPVISVVWVLTGSIFLLLNINPMMDQGRIAGIMLMQFFFIISIAIPFDVFGLIEDEMLTIPIRLGVRKALRISKTLLLFYFVVAIVIHLKKEFLYASALICLVTFLVIHFSPRFKSKEIQSYLLDGTIILQTLIFYFVLYRQTEF